MFADWFVVASGAMQIPSAKWDGVIEFRAS